jgi:signal peptidase I
MAINDLPDPITQKSSTSIRSSEGTILFWHLGNSMYPTIVEKDILEVRPYNDGNPRPGDIVVFSSAENDALIAHRAISIDNGGIITKGDNNVCADPSRLSCESIVGKVIAVWHQGSRRNMASEWIGWTLNKSILFNARLKPRIESIMDYLKKNYSFVFSLFSSFMITRAKVFKSERKEDMILLIGTRVAGRYFYKSQRWRISRPYCILIDKNSLPKPDEYTERSSNGAMALN